MQALAARVDLHLASLTAATQDPGNGQTGTPRPPQPVYAGAGTAGHAFSGGNLQLETKQET